MSEVVYQPFGNGPTEVCPAFAERMRRMQAAWRNDPVLSSGPTGELFTDLNNCGLYLITSGYCTKCDARISTVEDEHKPNCPYYRRKGE